MRRVLCIVTSDDALTKRVVDEEKTDCELEVVELGANPDYERLLDKILEAESVQVW